MKQVNLHDVLFIDLETQSYAKIENVLAYVKHPSTRILCAVAATYDGVPEFWDARTEPIPDFWLTKPYWVAHNAYGFDSLIWREEYPYTKVKWLDTMPMCRANGLPGSLDKVSQILFKKSKTDFKDLLKIICTARYKNGEWVYPYINDTVLTKLKTYNIQDVVLLRELFMYLYKTDIDYELLEIDQIINQRGVKYDIGLARQISQLWPEIQLEAREEIIDVTDGELDENDLRSNVKVSNWITSKGVNVDSLNKLTVREELAEYDIEDKALAQILTVLNLRETATRAGKGKIDRLIDIHSHSNDTRLRDWCISNGAHTGRYSGRGYNPLNLSRIDQKRYGKRLEWVLEKFEEVGYLTVRDLGKNADDILTQLSRPIFMADEGKDLYIADYSQIEARFLAWIANEETRLQMYKNGIDPYCEIASKVFNKRVTKDDKERQVGKVIELALGYNMSYVKFDIYCKLAKPRIDLAELKLDPKEVVKTYRSSVPAITNYWKLIELNCVSVINQGLTQLKFGRLTLGYVNGNLYIQLPSGRKLWYRNARIESRIPKYVFVLGTAIHYKPTIVYDHPHGREGILYGGLLTENICQGGSNDILRHHIKVTELNQFMPIVLHVHDEIVGEDNRYEPKEVEDFLMKNRPDWLVDFPLKIEVAKHKRYFK